MGKLGATEALLFGALVFLLLAERIFAWIGRLLFPKRPSPRRDTPSESASKTEPASATESATESATASESATESESESDSATEPTKPAREDQPETGPS